MKRLLFAVVVALAANGAVRAESPDAKLDSAEVSRRWLEAYQASDCDRSWALTAAPWRELQSKARWCEINDGLRKMAGKLVRREPRETTRTSTLPDLPRGEYVVMKFLTQFEDSPRNQEELALAREPDGQWRVVGYHLKSRDAANAETPPSPPAPLRATATVTGSLDKEIIRRVIRSHLGEIVVVSYPFVLKTAE
jgi:hypothetical protein